jgi:uncharacterized protein
MPRRMESLMLDGPAGKLEALLEEPEDGEPLEACLICHPHPLYGGTMHNKVVFRIARALRHSGAVVLRFNFRGAGASAGKHDYERGELEDARSALRFLGERYPSLPSSLAGFSFGARIALRLGCATPEVNRLILTGFPTPSAEMPELRDCRVPRIFIQSTHDQYGPREELQKLVDSLPDPKQLIWVEATDHFFAQGLDRLEEAVRKLGPIVGRP